MTGYTECPALNKFTTTPRQKGSVFDTFKSILTLDEGSSIVTSYIVKFICGSQTLLQVNSPHLRKPKKATVKAASKFIFRNGIVFMALKIVCKCSRLGLELHSGFLMPSCK